MNTGLARVYQRLKGVWLGDEGLTAFLLLLFVGIFIAPFLDSLPARLLMGVLFSLLILAGFISLSAHHALRYPAGAVACLAIVLRWLMHLLPTPTTLRWGTFASLVFLLLLTLTILYRVFGDSGPVTAHKIRGAVAVYLLFGITWSTLYGLLDQVLPNAFSLPAPGGEYGAGRQGTLTYFSFITLTTVGYGDLTPTHDVSRMFAVLEALTGQLYPATLLARLVSLEISHRGREGAG